MKVLLPVDGSDCANKTMDWAAATFDKITTEYYLLHVIPILPDLATIEYDVVTANIILQKARTTLQAKGCQVIDADYLLGGVADQVCRYVDLMDIDQVVVGSHGRTGFAKLLMGSNGEAILEHCHKPVIVYRNVERKPVQPKAEPMLSTHTIL